MNSSLRKVETEKDLRDFVSFPFKLYKGNPCWVPPLTRSEISQLTTGKNPAFEHSDAILLTAWKNGAIQGRIAGIINHLETAHLGEQHARFGWLEFVDDPEVSRSLLEGVASWAGEKQCVLLKGPHGFNQLDRNGMLTDGFDSLGTSTANFNYPYYPAHLEALGYEKDLDWVELVFDLPPVMPDKITRMANAVARRYGLKVFRPSGKEELRRLTEMIFNLLMSTYLHLPGFVPISDKQRDAYVREYARFLRLDYVHVVLDSHDNPIGFGLSLPSLSRALQKAGGRLFPCGIFHLLKARQWNDTGELALIGVTEEWRQKGVHSIIFMENANALLREGITHILANPMLVTNNNVLGLWKDFDTRIYRRRCTYRKIL